MFDSHFLKNDFKILEEKNIWETIFYFREKIYIYIYIYIFKEVT